MSNPSLTLSNLIGPHNCHDLISPIGAINNGLELVEFKDGQIESEMGLTEDSCAAATARIQFFRITYSMETDGEIISNRKTVRIITGTLQSERLAIGWHPEENLPRYEIQLALLLLQCFETALPYRGTIQVSRRAQSWRISCDTDRLEINPILWQHLSIPSEHQLTCNLPFCQSVPIN